MQKRQNKLKWNNYRIGLILTVAMTFVILLGISGRRMIRR